jgi:hypothetical protein
MYFWRKYVPWPRGIRFGVYAYRNTLVYTIDGLEKVYTFKVRPNRLTHASDLLHRHAMPAVYCSERAHVRFTLCGRVGLRASGRSRKFYGRNAIGRNPNSP